MNIEFQCTDEILSNKELCELLTNLNQYSFITKLSVLPPYVKPIKNKIGNYKLSTIIDFPLGLLDTNTRLDLIKKAADDGSSSVEMVMPSFLINNKYNSKIQKDIEQCYSICVDKGIDLYYILEYRLYNYTCIYRIIKTLLTLHLNDFYISTGYKLDNIYDHLIAIAMITKEVSDARIICNANIFNHEHLDLLEKSKLLHFRVNNLQILETIRQKYNI